MSEARVLPRSNEEALEFCEEACLKRTVTYQAPLRVLRLGSVLTYCVEHKAQGFSRSQLGALDRRNNNDQKTPKPGNKPHIDLFGALSGEDACYA